MRWPLPIVARHTKLKKLKKKKDKKKKRFRERRSSCLNLTQHKMISEAVFEFVNGSAVEHVHN